MKGNSILWIIVIIAILCALAGKENVKSGASKSIDAIDSGSKKVREFIDDNVDTEAIINDVKDGAIDVFNKYKK